MARKPPMPMRVAADLSLEKIKRAIPRIQKRIGDLEAFDPSRVERNSPEVRALEVSIEQTLRDIFGADTHEFHQYRSAASMDGGPITMSSSWIEARGGYSPPDYEYRDYYERSKQRAIALLRQAISWLEERATEMESVSSIHREPELLEVSFERKVFIVHGHEEGPREAVARFIEKIGFEAVILHERPNKGRTLINKFQDEAAGIGFAIVLMTADDVGGKNGGGALNKRARQNVVFELGFFIGMLGADRVAPLIAPGVEPPSDYDGVVYIPLDNDWKPKLAKELKAAGYEIDWNRVMD